MLQTCIDLIHKRDDCRELYVKHGDIRQLLALYRVSFSLALYRARYLRHLQAPQFLRACARYHVKQTGHQLRSIRARYPLYHEPRVKQLSLFTGGVQ